MKLLLDTHSILWLITRDRRLTKKARSLFLDSANTILLSIASVWELSIKVSLGRLELGSGLADFVEEHIFGNDIELLDLKLEHLYQIENLPFHHRDPFDRLIIAQAMVECVTILSVDQSFDAYPITRIWN